MAGYSEKPFYDRLVMRFEQLKKIRDPYDPCWDEIIDIYRPDMARFERKEGDNEIELLGEHIFEGTPAKSARIMSEGWQGYLVSRSIEWVKHGLEDLKGVDEVNKWLQEFDDYMYSVYKNSTMYDNLGMFCLDGVTVGSPVDIIEENERTGKVHHQVPHPAGRYFGNNAFGETDTLYLYRERSVKEAYELYGRKKRTASTDGVKISRDNDGFSDGLKHNYKEGHFDQKYKFIKCFHHFMDPIFENVKPEFKPAAPWMAYTIELDNTNKKVCKIERYWSKPFIDWPFEKRIGRAYATTPAWWSYYDSLSLQDAREGLLMSGKIKNRPPMWIPAFLKKTVELYPEGLNWPLNETQYKMKPEAILEGGDYPVGKDMEDQLRLGVEDWFHVKFFLMLSQWSMQQKAPPTAYHIMQMMGERAVLLAPRIGNFTRRLEEMDTRIVQIEKDAGRIPEPPPIVMEMSNGKLEPEFIGPLAQVQQQYHETRRMESTMLQVQPFINLDPMSARKIKAEVAIEHILEKNRFIQDAITSQEEYDEYVRAAAQQQQMREAVQLGTEVAKAIPSVSKDIEKNSPIALLSGAGAA
jgi:hypothetical protein